MYVCMYVYRNFHVHTSVGGSWIDSCHRETVFCPILPIVVKNLINLIVDSVSFCNLLSKQ